MRIKVALLVIVLTTLACTANVTPLNTAPSPTPEIFPTPMVEITQAPPTPSITSQPVVSPEAISKIHMIDSQNGWLITNTSVLRTQDGGTAWHNVAPPGASTLGFGTGFSFLDANRSWILIGDANDPVNKGMLYRTSDGGMNWTSNATPFGGGDIHFLDDANGWMMLPAGAGTGNEAVKFFQTTDGGVNWTQVYTNVPTDSGASTSLPYSGIKSGFTPINMQEAWVSGQTYALNIFYLYHTIDGGRTWALANYQLPFTGEAMYLTYPPMFFDPQNGLLPMTAGSEGSATLFLKTQDGGATWSDGKPVAGSGQYSIASLNDVFVWFGGELSVSHDSGQTWTVLHPNMDLSINLIQLQFGDAQNGWAVTSDTNGHTSLYKTTDGGQTWNVLVQ
jgi:photosystem II stability/assembly factor-like uncharacterized protein